MSNFVKLHRYDDFEPIWINLDTVAYVEPIDLGTSSRLTFVGGKTYINIREAPDAVALGYRWREEK